MLSSLLGKVGRAVRAVVRSEAPIAPNPMPSTTADSGQSTVANPDQEGSDEVLRTLVFREFSEEASQCPLFVAIQEGDVGHVDAAIASGISLEKTEGLSKKTALHMAVQKGSIAIVELLLKKGANPNAVDTLQRTPLHYAVERGNMEIINVLISGGANLFAIDCKQRTIMHIAADNGRLNVVLDLIVRHVPLSQGDTDGSTPLHEAVKRGHIDVAQALVDAGAPPFVPDRFHMTALHYALLPTRAKPNNMVSEFQSVRRPY